MLVLLLIVGSSTWWGAKSEQLAHTTALFSYFRMPRAGDAAEPWSTHLAFGSPRFQPQPSLNSYGGAYLQSQHWEITGRGFKRLKSSSATKQVWGFLVNIRPCSKEETRKQRNPYLFYKKYLGGIVFKNTQRQKAVFPTAHRTVGTILVLVCCSKPF